MDQNNMNNREPLPTYGQPQYQQAPQYQQPYGQPQYQYAQPQAPVQAQQNHPAIAECADSAFGKGLAATIMAWFPIVSIVAIAMGSSGLNLVEQAQVIAAQYGVEAGGKATAAKILSKIGKIGGIVMTIFWAFYFILIFAIIGSF